MRRLSALALVVVAACTVDPVDERSADTQAPAGSAAINDTRLFIGAGDIGHCSSNSRDEATAALIQQYPDAQVFTLGDNAYPDGTAAQFGQCYNPSWGAFKSRTRPVPGNHDYHTVGQPDGAPGYYGYFGAAAGQPGKGYYSYTLGSWRIYAINSEISTSASSAQVAWLKADLKANPAQCILAYWHRPLFTSSDHHAGSTSTKPLWAALEAAGAEIILNSHQHHYERFAPQTSNGVASSAGIRQFVAGGGGTPTLYNFLPTPAANSVVRYKGHGVVLLGLYPGGYTWKHLSLPGAAFTDSGSGSCTGGSAPPPPPPPPPPSSITLTVTGRTDATKQYMTLDWAGARGTTVDVFRNGARITNTANDGHYTNTRTFQGAATYTYKACEAGTSICSNEASVTFGGGGSPPNTAPVANFSAACSGLTCTFTDGSTDADGGVTGWNWSFGDGAASTARNPSRTYAAAGTYMVTLTVVDGQGAEGTISKQVAPSATGSPIVLTVTGRSDATTHYMTLKWTGAQGTTVDLYRNGALRATTPNDGYYVNSRSFVGEATYVYKLCEAGSSSCSNEATVVVKQ